MIRIAVAIARASSGVALPDPIVFVPGGPSAAAIDPGTIFVLTSLFGANRDMIFVDARGTGLSQPRLGCPEFDALAVAALPNAPRLATLTLMRLHPEGIRSVPGLRSVFYGLIDALR